MPSGGGVAGIAKVTLPGMILMGSGLAVTVTLAVAVLVGSALATAMTVAIPQEFGGMYEAEVVPGIGVIVPISVVHSTPLAAPLPLSFASRVMREV